MGKYLTFWNFPVEYTRQLHISLIKSGGGNGPMKPGNLFVQGAKSGGKTKDEDSIYAHRVRRCAVFCLLSVIARRPFWADVAIPRTFRNP